ncbi:hypothetical protein SK128_010376 [Halocaridina rubra]|uniref:Uncharacterized protein n=1 Tax=Halocaridina rubra TaxID=373956 RepID=A0AAN8WL57_HALRR
MLFNKAATLALFLSLVALSDAFYFLLPYAGGPSTAALVVGGLAALKAAAIVGYTAGANYAPGYRYHHYDKRSVGENPIRNAEEQKVLLSTASQLDPSGCILKFLCKLQVKEEPKRTLQEKALADMFNGTENLNSYSAPFFYASDVGSNTKNAAVCDKYYSNCPLSDSELGNLLQKAWGCGFENVLTEEGM